MSWRTKLNQYMRDSQKLDDSIGDELAMLFLVYETVLKDKIRSFFGGEVADKKRIKDVANFYEIGLVHSRLDILKASLINQNAKDWADSIKVHAGMSSFDVFSVDTTLDVIELGDKVESLSRDKLLKTIEREIDIQSEIDERLRNRISAKELADKVLSNAFHGVKWSDSIWDRQDELQREVIATVRNAINKGKNVTEVVGAISERFKVKRHEAKRLVVTEMARVATEVAREQYRSGGIEEYIYLAEPTACKVCSKMHNKVYLVSEMEPGVNAPPMHPHCHCATAPKN